MTNRLLELRAEAVERHEPLPEGLEPKPLLKFLARVETILLEKDIL
jgi:hypothetical protein